MTSGATAWTSPVGSVYLLTFLLKIMPQHFQMDSFGVIGYIQVNEETKQVLSRKNTYPWICRGEINVKGKGLMTTYLLKLSPRSRIGKWMEVQNYLILYCAILFTRYCLLINTRYCCYFFIPIYCMVVAEFLRKLPNAVVCTDKLQCKFFYEEKRRKLFPLMPP